MPTQSSTYNSRVTDEALEKRFRDTFKSQSGAELVDDLYAQGVIVPVVDFTAAATGQQLAENLQTAWDFSTGHITIANTTSNIITNSGFWKVDLNVSYVVGTTTTRNALINITDGFSTKPIWEMNIGGAQQNYAVVAENDSFVVFLRAGDSLTGTTDAATTYLDVVYRQIASVNGDLVNPTGFTSS